MPFFAMPYRVLFHDTMAYGSHHFLTNFKFQCIAREALFFDHILASSPNGDAEAANFVILTQQAYSRNLAPVRVGEKVAILVSAEEPTLSSVRFCFRVIRHDGPPVSCGFQTMVCLSSATGQVVSAPPLLLRGYQTLHERIVSPTFRELVLAGKVKRLFDKATVRIGVEVANAPPAQSSPRFVDTASDPPPAAAPVPEPMLARGVVFMLPGQGSFAPWILRDLRDASPRAAQLLDHADETCRRLLGHDLLASLEATADGDYRSTADTSPELAQVGIYLGAVLVSQFLIDHGLTPDLVVGHSAGELAALAVAGVYDAEVGVELVCHRVLALRTLGVGTGGMLAVFCDERRAGSLIGALGQNSLALAVVNHEQQVVVSGGEGDLTRLSAIASHLGIGVAKVQSPYPFHSPLLEGAVQPFANALSRYRFLSAQWPVYSPLEGCLYTEREDHGQLVASHFVRPLAFRDAVLCIRRMGGRVFIECGPGRVLTQLVRTVLRADPEIRTIHPLATGRGTVAALHDAIADVAELVASPTPTTETDTSIRDDEPIAIVSMGCVLPGAADPDIFWRNVLDRQGGSIRDAGDLAPELAQAFLVRDAVVPDKTYSLLGGFARGLDLDLTGLPYAPDELAALSWSQRFLAVATGQCLARLGNGRPSPARTHLYLGATADGIMEYDEALLVAALQNVTEARGIVPPEDAVAFRDALERAGGRTAGDVRRYALFPSHAAVADRLVGRGVKLVAVDAACASSLYAIDLGVHALRRGDCDLALCGGVFAPGPANSCLFAQFRGLSATGSRPFDANADGVVFGEGAAILGLKRLPDAIAANDHIHAVIRGIGLSNDGKTPSAAVPRKEGQIIALRRAYESTGVDPATVQYVEAHATATPVGDAVEFSALSEVFAQRQPGQPRVGLGSVKSLVGHTGWVAGAASTIKMALALETRQIPPQANFETPSQSIGLADSPFAIPTEPAVWPPNRDGHPRRAGIDGFGFGGSNAHLVLEAYEPEHHRLPPHGRSAPIRRKPSRIAVVGFGGLTPSADGAQPHSFDRSALRLPTGIRILPDVTDEMDPNQFLAVAAAAKAMEGLVDPAAATPGRRTSLRDALRGLQVTTGVVLGIEGKGERGIRANQRIYLDLIEHRLEQLEARGPLSATARARYWSTLATAIRQNPPSTPYTLPGLMPNVAAGRVANIFNLNGPNLVLDAGGSSLFESIALAETWLSSGACSLVFAGGVNAYAGVGARLVAEALFAGKGSRQVAEAAFVVLLATSETARAHGFPVVAELTLSGDEAAHASVLDVGSGGDEIYRMGADGALELIAALERMGRDSQTTVVRWPRDPAGRIRTISLAPPERAIETAERERIGLTAEQAEALVATAPSMSVFAPRLRPVSGRGDGAPASLNIRKVLFLTNQPSVWRPGEPWRRLNGDGASLLCTTENAVAGAYVVDLAAKESAIAALGGIDLEQFDAIVAVEHAADADSGSAFAEVADGVGLASLLFVVAKQAYGRLKSGTLALATVSTGVRGEALPASTGLFAGFLKSLGRELPSARCRALVTDERDPPRVLEQLAAELVTVAPPAGVEVVYRAGVRHEFRAARLTQLVRDQSPWIRTDSVVLVSGGARGVTAALVEKVMQETGCTVILLGRSDPTLIRARLRALTDKEFELYEPDFYWEEAARRPGVRPTDLKREYESYRAAREVDGTLRRLAQFGGRVEYLKLDVTDPRAVDTAVAAIVARFGRVDVLVHGAGVQESKALFKKSLAEFRRVIETKVGGLTNLYHACRQHGGDGPLHVHVLTSAFSWLGNDGQPDYGAANEAMNRIAAIMAAHADAGAWSSLAWLGWAGIGMTRGSEYAALAHARGLRPVLRAEGQALFARLIAGSPAEPVNVLLSDGEISFYGVAVDDGDTTPVSGSPPRGPAATTDEMTFELSLATHGYLTDHLVNGRPTLPATFGAELGARAARRRRSGSLVVGMESTRLNRFVRLSTERPTVLRIVTEVVSEDDEETVVAVRMLSDFVHKSGRVLQRDIPHYESLVRLRDTSVELPILDRHPATRPSTAVPDPYLAPDAPVQLRGFFDCLSAIEVTGDTRRARFRIKDASRLGELEGFLTAAILLDGLLRMSMVHVDESGVVPLYVPIRCDRTTLMPGINDTMLYARDGDILLAASYPRTDGSLIHNDWAQATDAEGHTLVVVEGLTALRYGVVQDATANGSHSPRTIERPHDVDHHPALDPASGKEMR